MLELSGYAGKDVATRSSLMLQLITEKAPSFRHDAPLLNPYFNLQIPETIGGAGGDAAPSLSRKSGLTSTSATGGAHIPLSALDPEQQTERSIRLLVHLFEALTLAEPLLVMYTHAHWMDDLSWRVVARMADAVPSVMMVLCMRPVKVRESHSLIFHHGRRGQVRV